jgi:hypothetical protein
MSEFISALADVSTMWLVCLCFIPLLIPLAIAGGMVYGMHKVLNALPPVFAKGQEGMAKVAAGATKASKSIAAPFVAVSASASRVKGMWRSLRRNQ